MIDIDKGHNLPVYSPTCYNCKWLHRECLQIPGKCKAFPDVIPLTIWTGKNDHHNSYPGDNGIQFDEREE